MVPYGFRKSKELRQVTSSNVVIEPQRKRSGTPISSSRFLCQGFNTLGVGSNFCPHNSLPRTYKGWGAGVPAPIRFFLNFPNMILHQHLPFSVVVRISLTHILT